MPKFTKGVLAATVMLVLSGCASNMALLNPFTREPEKTPVVKVPEGYKTFGMSEVDAEQWWAFVNVPQLTAVIEMALKQNADVRMAEQRLNEAAAALGIAKTDKWPGIFAQITSNRNRPTQAGNVPVFGSRNVYMSTRATLGMSWELDLWGRLASLEDAAAARMMQQAYNYKGVRLSVSATAATLYTRIRVFGLLVKVAEEALESREAAYELQKQRFEAGLTNEMTLRQVEAEYLAVKAQMPDLREQFANAQNAMTVLMGGSIPEIPPLDRDGLGAIPFAIIPEGTPSELLKRRPDVAAAEQGLLAQKANLEAARKAFFPSISLTGALGSESAELGDLFSGPARVWSASVNLTQPIFQAGRLMDERDAQVARQNQAVIAYESAVQTAFGEVYDALVAQREARERLVSREQQVKSLQRLVDLAQQRVDAGISSQLELLDAQRNLLSAQLDWARAWGSQAASLLSVIKALGGGFEAEG